MQAGILITGGAVDAQIRLAREAEAAGWDGVFTWDGIHVGDEAQVHDPWVLMSAFAVATQRVRIGAIIQPLARRRPWKVARESVTLDHVSNGRFVLVVGLGTLDDSGFGSVGEPTDRRTRAEKLDETLEILTGLWSGERFGFSGTHYQFEPMAFRPVPIQQPRIPIWVVGAWPSERSMGRAARYDGLLPNVLPDPDGKGRPLTLELLTQMRDWIAERRSVDAFDIVVDGTTPADDPQAAADIVQGWADAGATWWVESNWSTAAIDAQRHRIEAGPPRIASVGGSRELQTGPGQHRRP